MRWKWGFTEKSKEQFGRLDNQVRKRILQKLEFWIGSGKPLDFAETLINYELGSYRFRVGDYRLVFDIEGETIIVLAVKHRREIYK